MIGLGSGYSPSAGLAFDDAELERRLTWIWGSPRSGSTWLLEQLCDPLQPEVAAPAGIRLRDPAAAADGREWDALPVDESFISNHLAPAFGDPVEVDGSLYPGTLFNYANRKPSYAFSAAFEQVWRPEYRRFALVRLHSLVERATEEGIALAATPALIIKEVNGSHAADLVMSLFPRSRLLFLVRDGRDVVDSLLSAYAPGGFLARNQGRALETRADREHAVRWASRLWACNVDATLRAVVAHDPELCRTVRYEDLRAGTASTIGPLYGWLGLERDQGWVEATVAAHAFDRLPAHKRGAHRRERFASPGLWREHLSAAEQRIAGEIMGARLVRLGYDA